MKMRSGTIFLTLATLLLPGMATAGQWKLSGKITSSLQGVQPRMHAAYKRMQQVRHLSRQLNQGIQRLKAQASTESRTRGSVSDNTKQKLVDYRRARRALRRGRLDNALQNVVTVETLGLSVPMDKIFKGDGYRKLALAKGVSSAAKLGLDVGPDLKTFARNKLSSRLNTLQKSIELSGELAQRLAPALRYHKGIKRLGWKGIEVLGLHKGVEVLEREVTKLRSSISSLD